MYKRRPAIQPIGAGRPLSAHVRPQDSPKAVTALARLIYVMVTHGQEYTDRMQDCFEERYRQRVPHNLAQRAKTLGMQQILQGGCCTWTLNAGYKINHLGGLFERPHLVRAHSC